MSQLSGVKIIWEPIIRKGRVHRILDPNLYTATWCYRNDIGHQMGRFASVIL